MNTPDFVLMMVSMFAMGGMMGMRLRTHLNRRAASGSATGEAVAVVNVEDRPYRVGDPPTDDAQASPCNCCPRGPLHACPQCGAKVMRCTKHDVFRTDRAEGDRHWSCDGAFTLAIDVPLNFTHGTSMSLLCSPQRRVRMGFWRTQCFRHDLHVHQKCERCGWAGPAYIMKSENGR